MDLLNLIPNHLVTEIISSPFRGGDVWLLGNGITARPSKDRKSLILRNKGEVLGAVSVGEIEAKAKNLWDRAITAEPRS